MRSHNCYANYTHFSFLLMVLNLLISWSWTHYIAEDDLVSLILLPPPSKGLGCRCAPPCLAYGQHHGNSRYKNTCWFSVKTGKDVGVEDIRYHEFRCTAETSDAWSSWPSVCGLIWLVHSLWSWVFYNVVWLNQERKHMQISIELWFHERSCRNEEGWCLSKCGVISECKEFFGLCLDRNSLLSCVPELWNTNMWAKE